MLRISDGLVLGGSWRKVGYGSQEPEDIFAAYAFGDTYPSLVLDFGQQVFATDKWAKYDPGGSGISLAADFSTQTYGTDKWAKYAMQGVYPALILDFAAQQYAA